MLLNTGLDFGRDANCLIVHLPSAHFARLKQLISREYVKGFLAQGSPRMGVAGCQLFQSRASTEVRQADDLDFFSTSTTATLIVIFAL